MPRTRPALISWVVLAALGLWVLLLSAGPSVVSLANWGVLLAFVVIARDIQSERDQPLLVK